MKFFVYILESLKDKSLYTGQTSDLISRLKKHNKGYVKSTRFKRPWRIGYFEGYNSRSEAMWREWQLKKRTSLEIRRKLINEFDTSLVAKLVPSD